MVDWDALRTAARQMVPRAYAAYSDFPVGAAALADDGRVTRIDGRSNTIVGRGRVDASAVASIAAGRGGAWVSAPDDGTLWRIVPQESHA